MTSPIRIILRFLRDEEGATMVEYGLLLAFILVVVVAAVTAVGAGTKQLYLSAAGTI